MKKDKILHLIGNAHLDPVWLWRWPEGYEAARATFESALDRMNEEPKFIFTSSQAAVYQWIEQGDPELFDRIKARVKEGRWKIAGGWWMQTDCNIPSGESFARQGLYAQHYFYNKLGVMANTGYNVDSFGHNLMLPQILKKSGMDYYVFMRPGPHENPDIPERLFWWESPDGSKVLTFKIPGAYCTWGDSFERSVNENAKETDKYRQLMQFYGVGNHGGGPTKDNLARIKSMQEDDSLPELMFSSPDIYFEAISAEADDYPVWKDDLQHHASGCYAAHSGIKKNNRKIENKLAAAEMLSVYANVIAGLEYPKADLTRAWQGTLFNQFHDIMAGTSIIEAYEDAANLHGMAFQYANEAITYSTGALISKIDTSGDAEPIAVFNTLAWERDDYCECELHHGGWNIRIEDDLGNRIPCQVMFPSTAAEPTRRARLIFPVNIPSAGYRLYRAYHEEDSVETALKSGIDFLENDKIKLVIDKNTGQPASIFDKQNNVELLSESCVLKVIDDKSDTWSHNVFYFNEIAGEFGDCELQLIEEGPVRAAIRSTCRYNNSTVTQEFRLYSDADHIECACEIDWHEQHKALKLGINTNVENPKATYEIPYGHIERPANGEEEPGLAWVDVSNEKYGLCLVNDAKYSYDITGNTINLTMLRSPIYAHHDPSIADDPNRRYTYMDQGISSFTYRLVPHTGDWRNASPHKRALALNNPLIGINPSRHHGTGSSSGSFINTDAGNIIISAMKQAELDESIVIRCFETNGVKTDTRFEIPSKKLAWHSSIGAYEIKTFMIKNGSIYETDILERIISDAL